MSTKVQRKLTTILAADAAGYSRAMEMDEVKAFDALRSARSVFSKFIERHDGRIVNTAGDGLIAEFPSVVEAVQCAIEVQQELGGHSNDQDDTMRFRIGIHLGDVMIDGTDLLGEGVNLAARLESMAEPGGVLISQQVYDQVQHKLTIGFEYLGEKRPKNFTEDVSVYRLSLGNPALNTAPIMAKIQAQPSVERSTEKSEREQPFREQSAGEDLRSRIVRRIKWYGVLLAVLFVVNLTTGSPLWAHWPGLVVLTLIALQATPLFVKGWFKLSTVRLAVIVAALAIVNLFTWTGYPWVLWPAAALITIESLRRLGTR